MDSIEFVSGDFKDPQKFTIEVSQTYTVQSGDNTGRLCKALGFTETKFGVMVEVKYLDNNKVGQISPFNLEDASNHGKSSERKWFNIADRFSLLLRYLTK